MNMPDYDIFTDDYPQYNEGPSEEECFCKSAGIPAHEDYSYYEDENYTDY